MTIQKAGLQGYECQCDDCYAVLPETAMSFGAMLAAVRAADWLPVRNDETGEWEHKCRDCIPKWESPLERARRMFED